MKNIIQLSVVAGYAVLVMAGCGGGGSGGDDDKTTFIQRERLARPVVNEVFATVANRQHLINDTIAPPQDATELSPDIRGFMKGTAGRSDAITNVVNAVLVPDMMIADLSKTGEAAYLGNETGGATSATKSTFGGRKVQDDVVDISLGVVFGTTISDLGLAPADGKDIPTLTTDNVGISKAPISTGTRPWKCWNPFFRPIPILMPFSAATMPWPWALTRP